MKRKTELEELSEAHVSWISLVDSGAARTPFKIQKAEEPGGTPMLNFTEIFQDPIVESRVLAVAVSKGVDDELAKKLIEKAGLKAEERKDVEGAGVYEQGEGALDSVAGQAVTVKLNEHVAVVCDVSKGFSPFTGSTDFGETLKSLGFLPSFELGVDALRTTTFESLQKAETREDAAKLVGQAASDFAAHVAEMVKTLPEEVFKLEEIVKSEEQFSPAPNPTSANASEDAASTKADLTAGEAGDTSVAGSQAAADVEKEETKRTEARKAAFEALGLDADVIAAIELVVRKTGGIAASGVATGDSGSSQPGSRPEVDGKSDQEKSGESLAGPSNDATSSMPGANPQKSGVTKEELEALLAKLMAPLDGIGAKVTALEGAIEAGVAKAEKAGVDAVKSLVLGQPLDNDGGGDRVEVRYSEPRLIDTGMAAIAD